MCTVFQPPHVIKNQDVYSNVKENAFAFDFHMTRKHLSKVNKDVGVVRGCGQLLFLLLSHLN